MGETINWMGGWPKEGVVSAAEWEERSYRYAERSRELREQDAESLKEALAGTELLPTWGTRTDRMMLAPGADAAIDWIIKRWLQPGDAVLVERPTSRFALQAFRRAGVIPHAVPGDGLGLDPDELAESIRQLHPRLVYAAPDCTDPEGRVWGEARKELLLQICREEDVAVLLDERQALLCEEPPRGKYASGSANAGLEGVVFRVGEFPPGMVAGLRLGWICAHGEEEKIRELLPTPAVRPEAIPPTDLAAVLGLLQEGIEPIVKTMKFIYRARTGALVECLKRQQLEGVGWNEPQNGMHLWISLPEGLDADALLRAAWMNGLLFQPGGAFYASDPDRFKLRATAVHTEERLIRLGVQKLGDTMADFLGRWG